MPTHQDNDAKRGRPGTRVMNPHVTTGHLVISFCIPTPVA